MAKGLAYRARACREHAFLGWLEHGHGGRDHGRLFLADSHLFRVRKDEEILDFAMRYAFFSARFSRCEAAGSR